MAETYTDPNCKCQGRAWLCEQHPSQPFEHELSDGSICKGPGDPCDLCNRPSHVEHTTACAQTAQVTLCPSLK